MSQQNGKINYRIWRALSHADKTSQYFLTTNLSIRAQTLFWNDWEMAFQWFEENFTTN